MADRLSFRNPIIPGFHPDPSCILVDGIYYLVTSSFLYTPGIPIFTSKDLINWTHIGNVITRPAQLSFEKCTIRPGTKNCGGIWAPTIRHHNGVFYVVSTCVFPDKEFADHSRWQNYVWTSKDPYARNSWSDGVSFYFPGYDTSLFWDAHDGDRVYVQGSTYWRVQEGIAQVELNLETGESLSGEPKRIWSGTGRPIPEAPHMYHKDGWYYLLIAEGGTELDHCATIARSKSVWGPFEECPHNPIIHAADKDAYFQTIGHADIFQTADGGWFAVALATRDGRVNFPLGRETVLIPGRWDIGNWPIFDARVETLMNARVNPFDSTSTSTSTLTVPPSRPAIDEDVLASFTNDGDDVIWPHNLLRLRNPDERSYTLLHHPDHPKRNQHRLRIRPSALGDTLDGRFGSPSFVARRQTGIECSVEFELGLPPLSRNVPSGFATGMSVYLDFESHLDLVLSPASGDEGRWLASVRRRVPGVDAASDVAPYVILDIDTTASSTPDVTPTIGLRVIAYVDRYEFFVHPSKDRSAWVPVGSGLAKDVSGGFTGVVIGPFVEASPVASAGPGSRSEGEDRAEVQVDVHKWVYSEPAIES
ncbi:hypothetical protein BDV93DRAFT_519170 [Ceratobasidium sp. AG-I]|nr:hypothetical protein BDV93DRAFT_519170 [Ceratobasidium sp. AG-I]